MKLKLKSKLPNSNKKGDRIFKLGTFLLAVSYLIYMRKK